MTFQLHGDSLMPWGKYKGTAMKDVPPTYKLWLLDQTWIGEWPQLFRYLQQHKDEIVTDTAEPESDDFEGFNSYDDFARDFHGI